MQSDRTPLDFNLCVTEMVFHTLPYTSQCWIFSDLFEEKVGYLLCDTSLQKGLYKFKYWCGTY